MKNDNPVFNHIPSKEELLEVFNESSDPRSYSYNRKYKIPQINYFKVFINCFIPIFLTLFLIYVLKNALTEVAVELIICLAMLLLVLYIFFRLKLIAIFFIELYQSLAPISVREKCRFEPSCSEYMILCIKKCGIVRGLKKGLDRLKRCRSGDGGYDNP